MNSIFLGLYKTASSYCSFHKTPPSKTEGIASKVFTNINEQAPPSDWKTRTSFDWGKVPTDSLDRKNSFSNFSDTMSETDSNISTDNEESEFTVDEKSSESWYPGKILYNSGKTICHLASQFFSTNTNPIPLETTTPEVIDTSATEQLKANTRSETKAQILTAQDKLTHGEIPDLSDLEAKLRPLALERLIAGLLDINLGSVNEPLKKEIQTLLEDYINLPPHSIQGESKEQENAYYNQMLTKFQKIKTELQKSENSTFLDSYNQGFQKFSSSMDPTDLEHLDQFIELHNTRDKAKLNDTEKEIEHGLRSLKKAADTVGFITFSTKKRELANKVAAIQSEYESKKSELKSKTPTERKAFYDSILKEMSSIEMNYLFNKKKSTSEQTAFRSSYLAPKLKKEHTINRAMDALSNVYKAIKDDSTKEDLKKAIETLNAKCQEVNQTSKSMSLSDQIRLLESIQNELATIEKTYLLNPRNQETRIFRTTFLRSINR